MCFGPFMIFVFPLYKIDRGWQQPRNFYGLMVYWSQISEQTRYS